MDVSKEDEESCTGTSVYLSFAENSSSSFSDAYKTLEATDVKENCNEMNDPTNIYLNRTLEAEVFDNSVIMVKQNKRLPTPTKRTITPLPLCTIPENISQECKLMSSTPAKYKFHHDIDDIAFETKKHCFERKEDALSNSHEQESLISVNKEFGNSSCTDSPTLSSSIDTFASVIENRKLVTSEIDRMKDILADFETVFKENKNNSKMLDKDAVKIPMRPIFSDYSIKEMSSKTQSSSTTSDSEIPLLMEKISNIFISSMKDEADNVINHYSKIQEKTKSNDLNKISGKRRPSLLQADKCPYKSQMSVVVKTTLNSTARKNARKSMAGPMTRGSPLPIKKGDKSSRRSALPIARAPMMKSTSKLLDIATSSALEENTQNASSPKKKNQNQIKLNKLAPKLLTNPNKNKRTSPKKFTCNVCHIEFRIKSLLDAHKRTHEDGGISAHSKKSKNNAVASQSSASLNDGNQCKYCDKKFAIQRALNIHLLQNCVKIPPSEKRNLNFTEMNHVEKAQLPSFNRSQSQHRISGRFDLRSEKNEIAAITRQLVSNFDGKQNSGMPPPSPLKSKMKRLSNAGCFRTPNKSVPCHTCKTQFKSVLDYTNHFMQMHVAESVIEPSSEA